MLRRVALCAALLWGSLAAANKSNTNPRNCDGLRLLFKAVPEVGQDDVAGRSRTSAGFDSHLHMPSPTPLASRAPIHSKAPTPGKSMKAAYILDNKSHQNIISSVVGITLPGSVTYTSSNSKPMGSISTLADNVVTWANGGAIKAGGSKTYMAAATVGRSCLSYLWCSCCVQHGLISSFKRINVDDVTFPLQHIAG